MIQVTKRDGTLQAVSIEKITQRIAALCSGLNMNFVQIDLIAKTVVAGIYDRVSTVELDNLAAETAASLAANHPDYAVLAARIAVSNLHKETNASFSETMRALHSYIDPKTKQRATLIADDCMRVIETHAEQLDAAIDHALDFEFDFFGFKTLERSYLLRMNGRVVERPQHLFMRTAIGIHGNDIAAALETYVLMSNRYFIHATPTLFNACTPRPQMSSCFLLSMQEDSIAGIYQTLSQCAKISQSAGGIGLSIHNIRAKGSYIKGTGGQSNGIVPMLRVYNDTARYVDQGGNKRKGSFAIYLEAWHADIFDFLELKKNHGKEEARARDLFYGLWLSDLFMQRVEADADWSLFSPDAAPDLNTTFGDEFNALFERYEREGRAVRTVKARELWNAILNAQIETGTPYMLYKDHVNRKNNQANLGTIQCSNLCTEIVQYTSPDEVAVCNLASISLPRFVSMRKGQPHFDLDALVNVARILTRNLNLVIDRNFYPVPEAERSNKRHRPIGIGVQGLADVFLKMRIAFDSPEAADLNRAIFEAIYFGALSQSCELARLHGAYSSYEGSPMSRGQLQFDLWGVAPSTHWNWAGLRAKIAQYGVRNSLLVAPMPTASTSQILGNNECFEPYTSNIYTRRTISGEYVVVNRHLLEDLIARGLWSEPMKEALIAHNGSVQSIEAIPADLKALYKTAYEIKQRVILDMAADRGAFVCQSQSMNLFVETPTIAKLTSMHFHAWRLGLKTGMYYLRSKAASDPIKFTLSESHHRRDNAPAAIEQAEPEPKACKLDDPNCLMCGA